MSGSKTLGPESSNGEQCRKGLARRFVVIDDVDIAYSNHVNAARVLRPGAKIVVRGPSSFERDGSIDRLARGMSTKDERYCALVLHQS